MTFTVGNEAFAAANGLSVGRNEAVGLEKGTKGQSGRGTKEPTMSGATMS